VFFSLNKHAERVNAVSWLGPNTLVSIADTIAVWQGSGTNGKAWHATQEMKCHQEQINYLETLYVSSEE
jgi:hypothetical protein